MNEISEEQSYFLMTGPMGGYQDPRLPKPKKKFDIAECYKPAVRRFLDEAKYYLNIYNVVVQHFVSILPFEKYLGEDSDTGRNKKKRDRLYAVLWNAQELDNLLNSRPDEEPAALLEDDEDNEIDLEVEKSFQSLRELMASSSSVHDSENITEAGSLEELLKPQTSSGPSLISRLKDQFTKLLDDEVDKLKNKLVLTLPEFAEKKVNKLNKLVEKTIKCEDCIIRVENAIDEVEWSEWDRKNYRKVDLREHNLDEANHLIYAPLFVIAELELIFIKAYKLLKKINELEKVMLNKDPEEYAKLQVSKGKIAVPTGE